MKYKNACKTKDCERRKALLKEQAWVERLHTFKTSKKLYVGDICITPFWVSHSAYDAYMFLVETSDKRILFTGDYRTHSYLGKGLQQTLEHRVGQVDVLITEGTMVDCDDERRSNEFEVQTQMAEIMSKKKYIFVQSSSTDLERLASIYAATFRVKNKSPFVCDSHQKEMLELFGETAGKRHRLFRFGKVFNYSEKNKKLCKWMLAEGFVMLVRSGEKFMNWTNELLTQLDTKDCVFIYSQWQGYWDDPVCKIPSYIALRECFENAAIDIVTCHTTGHALPETIRMVCEKTSPREAIIPVHRDPEKDFTSIGLSDELTAKIVTKNKNNIIFED